MNNVKLKILEEDYNKIISVKNFSQDIGVGRIGEDLARQYLEKKGLTYIRTSEERADLKKWDLEFTFKNNIYRYEVKNDVYIVPGKQINVKGFNAPVKVPGRDTGNIFIEFHCRGTPSGISTTTADVWMNFFFHIDELWMIPVDRLRKLINENSFIVSEESGDDNSHTKGYLIPRNQYTNDFKVVKYQKEIITQ